MKRILPILMLLCQASFATTYYVKPSGNNTDTGTSWANAWATIAYAASQSLAPGDIVKIGAGTYTDPVVHAFSGGLNNHIVFENYGDGQVWLDVGVGNIAIDNNGKNYLTWRWVFIKNASYWVYLNDGTHHMTLEHMYMYNRTSWAGVKVNGSSYNVFDHLRLDPADTTGGAGGKDGDGIQITKEGTYGSHHNLVVDCFAQRSYHSALTVEPGDSIHHNVFLRDTVWRTHNGVDASGYRTIVQDCRFHRAGGWLGLQGDGIGSKLSSYGIQRWNVLVHDTTNNEGGTYDKERPVGGAYGVWKHTVGAAQYYSYGLHLYHNTHYLYETSPQYPKWPVWISTNDADGTQPEDSMGFVRVFNNIYYRSVGGEAILNVKNWKYPRSFLSAVFEGNVIHKDTGTVAVRYFGSDGETFNTVAAMQSSFPSTWWANNADQSLSFVDETGRDLTPTSGSYVVDKGQPLDKADGTGSSSTSLTLHDPFWFSDGYGITAGDSIKIGSQSPVGITSLNDGTKTATLSSARSWSDHDDIYIYRGRNFQGSAPDIGALEYLAPSGASSWYLLRQ